MGNVLRFGLFLIMAFQISVASANTIKKIKGTSALIQLDEDASVAPGDSFFALNDEGKKKAIIEIKKVKGAQAIGTITKGKAVEGMALRRRGAKASVPQEGESESRASSRKQRRDDSDSSAKGPKDGTLALGGLVGLTMNSMSLTSRPSSGNAISYEISGTGYVLGLMGDYYLSDWLSLRANLGLQRFAAAGGPSNATPCSNFTSNKCNTEISFFIGDIWARAGMELGPGKLHGMLGAGVWFPSSYSTNALDASSITTIMVFGVGAGYDFYLSDSLYIPVQFQYRFFPSSNDVKTSVIGITAGLAWLL